MSEAQEEELARIWAQLTRGAADKRSALNTPAIATVSTDGAPSIRTVVLRAVRPADRLLQFHTDPRSAKFAELATDARVSWHFWEPRQKVQLRVATQASLHHGDAVARTVWGGLHSGGRRIYRQAASPGGVVNDPAAASDTLILEADAFENFAVVNTTAIRIEWLHLATTGHRRAHWVWDDAQWSGAWLAP